MHLQYSLRLHYALREHGVVAKMRLDWPQSAASTGLSSLTRLQMLRRLGRQEESLYLLIFAIA